MPRYWWYPSLIVIASFLQPFILSEIFIPNSTPTTRWTFTCNVFNFIEFVTSNARRRVSSIKPSYVSLLACQRANFVLSDDSDSTSDSLRLDNRLHYSSCIVEMSSEVTFSFWIVSMDVIIWECSFKLNYEDTSIAISVSSSQLAPIIASPEKLTPASPHDVQYYHFCWP